MSLLTPTAVRSLLLERPDAPESRPVRRLLDEVGHDVHSTSVRELTDTQLDVDLLLIDLDDAAAEHEVLRKVSSLPLNRRPQQVVVLAGTDDAPPSSDPTVHVFGPELHMHGLLSVLRRLHAKVA